MYAYCEKSWRVAISSIDQIVGTLEDLQGRTGDGCGAPEWRTRSWGDVIKNQDAIGKHKWKWKLGGK